MVVSISPFYSHFFLSHFLAFVVLFAVCLIRFAIALQLNSFPGRPPVLLSSCRLSESIIAF